MRKQSLRPTWRSLRLLDPEEALDVWKKYNGNVDFGTSDQDARNNAITPLVRHDISLRKTEKRDGCTVFWLTQPPENRS